MTLFSVLLSLQLFSPLNAQSSVHFPQLKVPRINLDWWNSSEVIYYNNCYNYATNRATNSFAQPGETGGMHLNDLTCETVKNSVSKDLGIENTEFFDFRGPKDDTLIALVVWPDADYHWYRRGSDGKWSHKPGSTPATNLDASDKIIENIEKADHGPYKEFCGYFKVKNYPLRSDEQNSGYVRIGNMTELPDITSIREVSPAAASRIAAKSSFVEVLQFSGLQNTKAELKVLLENDVLSKQNLEMIHQLMVRGRTRISKKPEEVVPRLGYRGIQVVDKEGLIFPKGSEIRIKGSYVISKVPNRRDLSGVFKILGHDDKKPLRVEEVFKAALPFSTFE